MILLVLATLSPTMLSVGSSQEEAFLVINEVLYNPVEGEEEWVELYNAGPEANLEGVRLSDQDGHDYDFPSLVFPTGAYLVLMVGDGVDRGFEDGPAVLHMNFSFSILNNAGDDVLLEGYGGVLDFMSYGDGSGVDPPPPPLPWEGSAEPSPKGQSLALQPNGLVDARPRDWSSSLPTPGRSNGPQSIHEVLISEVYYHTFRDDEYVVLHNAGTSAVNLSLWRVTDGEGGWGLPEVPLLLPGRRFVISANATLLLEDAGILSDVCESGCPRLLTPQGNFVMANSGDEVELYDPYGRLVDSFVYGSSGERKGWEGGGVQLLPRGYVARRRDSAGTFQDTDSALDWEWSRTFRLGQSFRDIVSIRDALVKPFISPESSLQHLLSVLDASTETILISGFKMTSWTIASSLVAALERGVMVHIGLEGTPPGGTDEDQEAILSLLVSKGASVLLMHADASGFRRYAAHHAKYVVVDETWVVQGSENFSDNGYPPREEGNRGWGVVVQALAAARLFTDLFSEDWNTSRGDIQVFGGPRLVPVSGVPGPIPHLPLDDFSAADITILLSPDNAVSKEGLMRVLKDAASSIDAQVFYLRWDWDGHPNPLVELLIDAARRGVRVRLLLDGTSYNLEGNDDNDEAVARLNRLATEEGIPLEARLLVPGVEGVIKLHNKGLLVDDELVLTSSMNWNYHGAFENREVGLLLQSPDLAEFFSDVFEGDWSRQLEPLTVTINGPSVVAVGEEATYEAELSREASSVTYAWDLHGDGTWDGFGERFSFKPETAGTYLLRLKAEDGWGISAEADVSVVVTTLPSWFISPGIGILAGVASGAAGLLLVRKLRTKREPTNSDLPQGNGREERGSDFGSGN